LSRTLPDRIHVDPGIANERLSYPLTYSNALGMLIALGLVLCFAFATRASGPRTPRVLGSAALPALGATLLLTFARGPMIAGGVALIAYCLLARPRGFASGVIAAVPTTAVAIVAAYRADLLATVDPTTPAAAAQGHDLVRTVVICTVVAAVLRLAGLALDSRFSHMRLPAEHRRRVLTGAWIGGALAVLVVLLALHLPRTVSTQYENFVNNNVSQAGAQRNRLSVLDNGFRLRFWDTSLNTFSDAPLHGRGAGTWQTLWAQERPVQFDATDGHSLYLEVLAELGIVGLALLGGFLVLVLFRSAALARGPNRPLYAAIFAAFLGWAVHAGVDWDWEAPALTIVPFVLAGAVLARPKGTPTSPPLTSRARVGTGLLLLLAAVTPALILLSQSKVNSGARALEAGRWEQAAADGRKAVSMLPMRPEPYEILGYANMELDRPTLAVEAMRKAVEKDPNSWESHYFLGLAQASAGLDPRRELDEAYRLNPREPLTIDARQGFKSTKPADLAREARDARRRALSAGRLLITVY
jgi:hypothetical protein